MADITLSDDDIVKLFDSNWNERTTVQQTWDWIEKLVMPYRGKFFHDQRQEHSIEWRHRFIYDSTAPMAAQNLASALHAALTNPADQWFELAFRDSWVYELPGAAPWVEECTKRTFEALNDSNFGLETNEVYQDLVGFGTSIITEEVIDEGGGQWRGLDFTAVPLKEAYFDEDHKGRVHRFYRLWQMTPSMMVTKWGFDNVPIKVQEAYNNGNTDRIDVIYCIWQRHTRRPAPGQKMKPTKRPYGAKYVLRHGKCDWPDGRDSRMLGEEHGYYEMPAFAPRFRKTSLSKWGHSPSQIALADILTVNQLMEYLLKSTEKVIDPTILAEERAILSDLSLEPGALNTVRKVDGFKTFESDARVDVGFQMLEYLRNSIKSYFYIDQLELKESPAMTATEVNIRYELMQRLLGPTMARLQSDYLDPCVKRTFNILFRAGQMPDIPPAVAQSGTSLDIQYRGPLSRSMTLDEAASVERWTTHLAQLGQVAPDILDAAKWSEVGAGSGRLMGVPSRMINTQAEMEAARAQRAQMMQEMQQAELDKTNAEARNLEQQNPS